ncbi:phosphate ABC transporter permease PstA [Acidithiobacillus sp.]|uniref:phosphate ABC transporter permease PstA n=1 Tax=Acidithiobacillus sp. TaxID=1872118 RepID=UPI0025C533DA|nr:phosphate ABC transporter permease PstA [Acidithiobacillus sp.]
MNALYARRRFWNFFHFGMAMLVTVIGLVVLLWITWTTLRFGFSALNLQLFRMDTPAPGNPGGLRNAFVGSLLLVGLAVLAGTPLGILAGTFLAEFSQGRRIGGVVRFFNDILLSAPSIVIGLFAYSVVVYPMGHYSGWAGAVALAIIFVPVVLRTTDEMLRLVPGSLREAALALGAPYWTMILRVTYRAAGAGILTGILLALARISGETAPLIFTVLNNQFWSTDLGKPIASLPVAIYQFAMSPYADLQALAWAGALVTVIFILLLSLAARYVLYRSQRS